MNLLTETRGARSAHLRNCWKSLATIRLSLGPVVKQCLLAGGNHEYRFCFGEGALRRGTEGLCRLFEKCIAE